jgi:hypothetical protein
MAQIENTDRVMEVAGRWMPSDVAFIKAFSYTAQAEGQPSTLLLTVLLQRRDHCKTGWPAPDVPMYQVAIEFLGVSQLHLKEVGSAGMQVTGFDIIDASDRGWEHVAFEIEDYENGQIGFLCAAARILSVTEASLEV